MSCWLLNKRYEFKTWFRTPSRSIRSSSPNKTTNRMKYSMLNYYLLFAKRSIYIVVPHHPLAHVCIAFKLQRARARAFMQRIYCSAPAYKNARAGKGTRAYTDTSSTFVCAFFFRFKWSASHTHTAGIRPFQVFIFYAWIAVWWPRHSVAIALGSRTDSHRWLCAYAQRNRNVIPFFSSVFADFVDCIGNERTMYVRIMRKVHMRKRTITSIAIVAASNADAVSSNFVICIASKYKHTMQALWFPQSRKLQF